jgi:hypothetical protein
MNIELSKDTGQTIISLLQLIQAIKWHYQYQNNEIELKGGKTIDDLNQFIIDAAKVVFSFIKELEEEYVKDPAATISLTPLGNISKGNLSDFNLKGILDAKQSIVNKVVLLDSTRRVFEASVDLFELYLKAS